MGIGGDVEYRQNTISVNLRAVSVRTGEVLVNVTVSKTLASVALQGGAFKFVDFDQLLEVEAGITNNEPGTMALRRAIEKAVYSMVIEGSQAGLWGFADEAAAAALVNEYYAAERQRLARRPSEPEAGQARSSGEAIAADDGARERRTRIDR